MCTTEALGMFLLVLHVELHVGLLLAVSTGSVGSTLVST